MKVEIIDWRGLVWELESGSLFSRDHCLSVGPFQTQAEAVGYIERYTGGAIRSLKQVGQ